MDILPRTLEDLWAAYQEHYESSNVAVRLLRRRNNSWINRLPKK